MKLCVINRLLLAELLRLRLREVYKDVEAPLVYDLPHNITLRQERRIEEAPAAYKPIQSVIDVQLEAEMVDVVARLSPVLTFKA
ncbi:RtcB family protein [Nostoc sp. CHAB 5784]|uniref:RtcB family protein n=1 Tax=Nostoc mirabile TaxID=2907820 RepID=UPI001E5EB266|nr:RtcB family protein [Nostoc mirabile]MCC5664765.1 RtcB family protein [Nostoc mirabile CHAB5784]